ncbi:MAG: YcgL domain-containing protein, partial [Arenicellales bacterium]
MTIKCDVYKSARKANTYLYLEAGVPHDELPDALQSLLGELSQFLRLDLNPESKLAQVKPEDVITSIKEQGYF